MAPGEYSKVRLDLEFGKIIPPTYVLQFRFFFANSKLVSVSVSVEVPYFLLKCCSHEILLHFKKFSNERVYPSPRVPSKITTYLPDVHQQKHSFLPTEIWSKRGGEHVSDSFKHSLYRIQVFNNARTLLFFSPSHYSSHNPSSSSSPSSASSSSSASCSSFLSRTGHCLFYLAAVVCAAEKASNRSACTCVSVVLLIAAGNTNSIF